VFRDLSSLWLGGFVGCHLLVIRVNVSLALHEVCDLTIDGAAKAMGAGVPDVFFIAKLACPLAVLFLPGGVRPVADRVHVDCDLFVTVFY
jgi:hypothetical protein